MLSHRPASTNVAPVLSTFLMNILHHAMHCVSFLEHAHESVTKGRNGMVNGKKRLATRSFGTFATNAWWLGSLYGLYTNN